MYLGVKRPEEGHFHHKNGPEKAPSPHAMTNKGHEGLTGL